MLEDASILDLIIMYIFTVGDQRLTAYNRIVYPDSQTKAQNYVNGIEPDGRSGILRITQDGETVVGQGILGIDIH